MRSQLVRCRIYIFILFKCAPSRVERRRAFSFGSWHVVQITSASLLGAEEVCETLSNKYFVVCWWAGAVIALVQCYDAFDAIKSYCSEPSQQSIKNSNFINCARYMYNVIRISWSIGNKICSGRWMMTHHLPSVCHRRWCQHRCEAGAIAFKMYLKHTKWSRRHKLHYFYLNFCLFAFFLFFFSSLPRSCPLPVTSHERIFFDDEFFTTVKNVNWPLKNGWTYLFIERPRQVRWQSGRMRSARKRVFDDRRRWHGNKRPILSHFLDEQKKNDGRIRS